MSGIKLFGAGVLAAFSLASGACRGRGRGFLKSALKAAGALAATASAAAIFLPPPSAASQQAAPQKSLKSFAAPDLARLPEGQKAPPQAAYAAPAAAAADSRRAKSFGRGPWPAAAAPAAAAPAVKKADSLSYRPLMQTSASASAEKAADMPAPPEPSETKKPDLESTAGLEWEHYLSPPLPGSHQQREYFSAVLDYRQIWQKGHFSLKSHVLAKYYMDKSQELYFDIPEIYGSYSYSFQKKIYSIESVDAAFGRKVKKWSFADDYWEMGVWNPQNLWNPMRASWNGLIGSFVDVNSSRWTLSLFAGPLYLPGSAPKWKLSEGRILSSSRWFSAPPGQVDVARRSLLDIKYHIDHPFLRDILLQQSYALSLEMRAGKAKNIWAKLSGGYKPVNDLTIALKTEEYLKVFSEEGKKSQVQPQVTYLPAKQWALSLDSGLKFSLRRNIGLSCVLSSGISKTSRKKDAASRELALLHGSHDFAYLSALAKAAFSAGHYAQAGYLKSWLKNKKDREVLSFDRRKIWHGLGFEWHWEFFSPKKLKRELSFKFRYSLPEKGGMFSARALFYLLPKVSVAAIADILGAKASGKDRFLGHFQANDYFGLKAAYVF